MTDKAFETSLIGLTAAVVLWLVLGIVLGVLAWGWVVVVGLVVEIVGGGFLLHYWGKNYMARE
ncbi:MAG: hypothetical protein U9O84_05230 [Chloroflexota bacterium]|nr:hypothetical protein [Chloroflexota bacterium]HCP60604.1 hypothetical protein [Dehalococcoidia bacterium]